RDQVTVAFSACAATQRAQVRAAAGFREDSRGQDLCAGDPWKPVLSLLWRASQADQLGGDLRARAEGTQADIAARQLFRHHAHRSLAKSEPTVFFWYGEAKDAKLGQSLDHFQGNKIVCEMPLVSSFRVFVGKAPELLGDEGVGFVQSPLTKVSIETEFSDALPNSGTIAERDQA